MTKRDSVFLGGGCFWCTEAIFQQIKGIKEVTSGYAGGKTKNPSYEDVCSGKSGHAEVVKIEFNPSLITFETLLDIFFHLHDPTTPNRQGADIGSQYRSIILATSQEQLKEAERLKDRLEKSGQFSEPIVTEIKMLDKFYPAEDYHFDYYRKNSNQPYCRLVISPKMAKLREKYFSKLSR